MNRENLIKKTIFKLAKSDDVIKKITKSEVMKLIYTNFASREEVANDSLKKKDRLNDREVTLLRKIYDYGDIKQLYTYGTSKFGFQIDDLRFDVDPAFVEIKKVN
jgi:hypothetical protein